MTADPALENRDVVDVLTEDHREIEGMLRTLAANADARLAAVLVATLIRHAVAEQEFIYPTVREQVPGGERIADRAVSQDAQVEETIQQMATTDSTDPRFRHLISALAGEVRRHVDFDESELFPRLRRSATRAELVRLGERVAGLESGGSMLPRHWHGPEQHPAGLIDQLRASVIHRRTEK